MGYIIAGILRKRKLYFQKLKKIAKFLKKIIILGLEKFDI